MGFLLGGSGCGLTLAEQPFTPLNTFLSGLVFSMLELNAPGIWLFQLKGQAVIVKFLLLGAAVASPHNALAFLVTAVIIGGISSHMPGKNPYYSIQHGRAIKE